MVTVSRWPIVAIVLAVGHPACLADKVSLEEMLASSGAADAVGADLGAADAGVDVDTVAVPDAGDPADGGDSDDSGGGDSSGLVDDAAEVLAEDVGTPDDLATADAPDASAVPDAPDTVPTADAPDAAAVLDTKDAASPPDVQDAADATDAVDGAPASCKDGDTCDDGQPCTLDACGPGNVCAYSPKPDGAPCSDGLACTQGDACTAGKCKAKPIECADTNPCTTDSCNPASGECVYAGNLQPCNDGNPCTAPDVCGGGACKGSQGKDGTACDDANKCTAFDACAIGVCAGKAVQAVATCDDGNACTADTCEPATGCKQSPVFDSVPCPGGAGLECLAGKCVKPACPSGGLAIPIDDDGVKKVACGAMGPVWGQRPDSPTTFAVDAPGTVLDSQTKLAWQQAGSDPGLEWSAALAYCDKLTLAGKHDWRLPTIVELSTIVDRAKVSPPATPDVFLGTGTGGAGFYWSANPIGGAYFHVNFGYGQVNEDPAQAKLRARCVRSNGQVAASGMGSRFVSGTDTALDSWTKLEWQRFASPDAKSVASAKAACSGLALAGSGWRLPTVTELQGIIRYDKPDSSLDAVAFPAAAVGPYWSSTGYLGNNSAAFWFVGFNSGNVADQPGNGEFRFRCVR